MNNERKYWLWFARIENISSKQKQKLLEVFKTPEEMWNLNRNELISFKTDDESVINELLNLKYRFDLEKYEKYMEQNNIHMITINDSNYPQKLKNIYDKPVVIFAKGNLKLLAAKSVAVVGCRECSFYGRNIAEKFSGDLAKKGICIISGLARGIDKYAHIGALNVCGNTIAVLGNGIDYIYPYENKDVYKDIIKKNGLILTEYFIGTRPSRLNFPARNRIISGLSDGILVVEAKEKSGALITVDFGLEQGKEIFAIPGNINSCNSIGTNELIKQGANLVTDYNDILEII